jgi:hypothetical protein
MRRILAMGIAVTAILLIAAPASGYFHQSVQNPVLHWVLDVLTLAVVTSPLWTIYAWGGQRRPLLYALVCVVQLPVAVLAFLPMEDPALRLAALMFGLGMTATSIAMVRISRAPNRAPARPAGSRT